MSMSVSDFREHLQAHQENKGNKAARIYGSSAYDYAIPSNFRKDMAEKLGVTEQEVRNEFIWIYPSQGADQVAPLSEKGCLMLDIYHMGEEWDDRENVNQNVLRTYWDALSGLTGAISKLNFTATHAANKANRFQRTWLVVSLKSLLKPFLGI